MKLLIPIILIGLLVGCKAKEPMPHKTPDMTDVSLVDGARQEITLTGKLVRKQWTKSTESFCAQGSDYYVIKTSDEALVLEFDKAPKTSMIDKSVTIQGYVRQKIIEMDSEGQHPVGEGDENTFTCSVFVVEEIELAK